MNVPIKLFPEGRWRGKHEKHPRHGEPFYIFPVEEDNDRTGQKAGWYFAWIINGSFQSGGPYSSDEAAYHHAINN